MTQDLILGACTNTASCTFRGSCQAFVSDDDSNVHINTLRKRCICGCYGSQHRPINFLGNAKVEGGEGGRRKNGGQTGAPTPPTEVPTKPASVVIIEDNDQEEDPASDPDSTPSGKKNVSPPVNSLWKYAQRQQEDIRMKGRDDTRFRKAFDVSSDVHRKPSSSKRKPKEEAGGDGPPAKKYKSVTPTEGGPNKPRKDGSKKKGLKEEKKSSSKKEKAASTQKLPDTSPEPAQKKITGKVKVTETEFTFVLVHLTDAAHQGLLEKPTVQTLRKYQVTGNMTPVTLNSSMDEYDICGEVAAAFRDAKFTHGKEELVTGAKAWLPLIPVPQGNGKPDKLELPIGKEPGLATFQYISSIRTPSYRGQTGISARNLIFICFEEGQPDIPVPGITQYDYLIPDEESDDDDSSDNLDGSGTRELSDSDSDESDFIGQSKNKEEQRTKREGNRRNPARGGDGGDNVFQEGDKSTMVDNENVPYDLSSSVISQVTRMVVNIHPSPKGSKRPHDQCWFFPSILSAPYVGASRAAQKLSNLVDTLQHDEPGFSMSIEGPLGATLDSTLRALLRSLAFVTDLAEWEATKGEDISPNAFHQSFQQDFRLGPQGLKPIINALQSLDDFLRQNGHHYSSLEQCNTHIDDINIHAQAMISLITHFTSTVPHAYWDPDAFRILRYSIDAFSKELPYALEADRLSVLDLTLGRATVQDFVAALTFDFGTVDNPSAIHEGSIKMGIHGLYGLLNDVFAHFLDAMPVSHQDYPRLYQLFSDFALALSKKIDNMKKSASRKKRKAAPNVAPTMDSKPRTRSQSQPGEENIIKPKEEDEGDERLKEREEGGKEDNQSPKAGPTDPSQYTLINSDMELEGSDFDVGSEDTSFNYKGPKFGERQDQEPSDGLFFSAEDFPDLSDDTDPEMRFYYAQYKEFLKTGRWPKGRYWKPKVPPHRRRQGDPYDWSWLDELDGMDPSTPFNLEEMAPEDVIKELALRYPVKNGNTAALFERLEAILTLVPHPDPKKRKTLAELGYEQGNPNTYAMTWKKMCLIYHVDKNVLGISPRMQAIFLEVAKLLINSRPVVV